VGGRLPPPPLLVLPPVFPMMLLAVGMLRGARPLAGNAKRPAALLPEATRPSRTVA
jgi:hypothetical protein